MIDIAKIADAEQQAETRLLMSKQTINLDNIIRRLGIVEDDLDIHVKEAEKWKRQIIRNSLQNDNSQPRVEDIP